MTEQFFYPILIILIIAIFSMAVFCGKLWAKIQVAQAHNEIVRKNERERLRDLKKSLMIIAKGLLDGRCEPAEGCIRIVKLIPRFGGLIDKKDERLNVLFEMYEKVADFKYLDAIICQSIDMYIDLKNENSLEEDNCVIINNPIS